MNHILLGRKFRVILSTCHHRYRLVLRLTTHQRYTTFTIFPTQSLYHTCHIPKQHLQREKYLLPCIRINGFHIIRASSRKTNVDQNVNNNSNSSSSSNKDNKNNSENNVSIFRKVKRMVDIFWGGCKALGRDVRLAVHTRRKLGLYHAHDYDRLTRQELRHLRQTREDVVKTFPVAFLFMVPFIGYMAPIMAYFYPKRLLSQQFWHPDQKKEFVLEEYEKRSQYYLPLIKEVAVTSKEIKNKELLRFCLQILEGVHPKNEELLYYKKLFLCHEDLNLTGMPRYHLTKLCKCWLIPTGWYLPRWFLMSALRKRIARLHEDDMFILRDGIHMLSPESVEQAVHVRGLDEGSLCDVSKIHWLTDWVDVSCKVKEQDVSFLAHAAVFKAANFELIRNGTTTFHCPS